MRDLNKAQTTITPDLQFLINCCKTTSTQGDIEQICTYISQFNYHHLAELINLAYAHGIFPLVYRAIKAHTTNLLSQEAIAELKRYNLSIAMQNMQMVAELIHIIRLFKENGITALAFKGPALAQFAYGDITLRQYTDLDILIKKENINQAVKLLTDIQYIPEIILSEKAKESFFACVNVIALEKNIRIEIHWELLAKNYAIDWREIELWQNIETISINNTYVPTLSYNSHLLYLCTHGSKHLFERLEWVSDIDRFIKANPSINWVSLFAEAQAKGIQRMLLLSLYLCHKLLALPLPEEILSRVDNDPIVEQLGNELIKLHFSTPATPEKSYSSFWLLWRMRERVTDRIGFACKGLFSPTLVDFKYLALPRQLIFLYPFIRPIRLLMKYY